MGVLACLAPAQSLEAPGLAHRHRPRRRAAPARRIGRALTSTTTVALAGVAVVLLSEVMRILVERALNA